jgi:hypothetical protein
MRYAFIALLALAACEPGPSNHRVWVPIIPRDSVDAIDVVSIRDRSQFRFRATVRNGLGEQDVVIDCGTGVITDIDRDIPPLYGPPLAAAYCAKAGL